jgi:AcrR family transcriptional regulator
MTEDRRARRDVSHAEREARRAARRDERQLRHSAREARRRHGRSGDSGSPGLTADEIGRAALAIIDRDGLDALTVRRLATELDVGTMTLYWYVRDKDQVLDLVKDQILGEAAVPPEGSDWRERATAMAHNLRHALLAHPEAASIVATRPATGPRGAALLEHALGVLAATGLGDEAIANAYWTIWSYVTGFVAMQAANTAGGELSPARREAIERAMKELQSMPLDRFPHLVRLAPSLFDPGLNTRFESGLRSIIDGIAADR